MIKPHRCEGPARSCFHNSPKTDCRIFGTSSEMAGQMRAPTDTETFLRMAYQFKLRIDFSCWETAVFCSIPDHDTAIGAHCSDDIRVLRLVPGLVDFSLMINFLHDVEFDFHGRLLATAVAANFAFLFIIILDCWDSWIGKLYLSYLEIVLGAVRCVSAEEESMCRVWFPGNSVNGKYAR